MTRTCSSWSVVKIASSRRILVAKDSSCRRICAGVACTFRRGRIRQDERRGIAAHENRWAARGGRSQTRIVRSRNRRTVYAVEADPEWSGLLEREEDTT